MSAISILNDVLGPVMRGPSSSHTAGPYHIGRLARALLGEEPASVCLTFDPGGSIAEVYREQGSDLGFAAGLLGWHITDDRFAQSLELAAGLGLDLVFTVAPLPEADHPNSVQIEMRGRSGRSVAALAKSIGGGAVVFTRIDGWPVHFTGDAYEELVEATREAEPAVTALLNEDGAALGPAMRAARDDRVLLHGRRRMALDGQRQARLRSLPGVRRLWSAAPVFFVPAGKPLAASATEMVSLAEAGRLSLGGLGLEYEARLLGLSTAAIETEMLRRYRVMKAAVERGLSEPDLPLVLLQPSATRVFQAQAAGRVAIGGLHTRAAARALAVMHVNGSRGVVCAAPTAGSAGTLPAVLVTLALECGLDEPGVARAMLAAGAVGLVVATRATFAAEVAGCQVEIGAAGAMAAAAVVEAAGGNARQACDAAAISFQNTMGSVCDLVQGIVEIPCHTRNAVAASAAFVCADLILGGYVNPIPLDETIDAVYAVGQMLPRELRVTALGGLAQAPSALALKPRTSSE